jgi:DNA methylase
VKPDLFESKVDDARCHQSPVACLGLTFENEEARRNHFTEELRKKLQDPEFRRIEGFPVGADEDILKLSDPPYYTACPNPWISEFISEWDLLRREPKGGRYHREPFAADVSEGKNDPIYTAHSYHTKVPHKAIMRYILHYTEPGDTVFDGFCGTGMTGVAAQMCANREAVLSLGYTVSSDGTILKKDIDEEGLEVWKPFSKLGARCTLLSDLSPAATFIAYNYNSRIDTAQFEAGMQDVLSEVYGECGWMYETAHTDGSVGKINYTVWSDVFVCPECTQAIVFWNSAVDSAEGKVKDSFSCSACNALLSKRGMDRSWTTKYDQGIGESVRIAKQVPVLINYSIGGKRHEKTPDKADLELIGKVDQLNIPYSYPIQKIEEGDKTGEPRRLGIEFVHQYFTKRSLWVFSAIFSRLDNPLALCALIGGYTVGLKTARFLPLRWIQKDTGPMKPHTAGTLYIPSLNGEQNWLNILSSRISSTIRAQDRLPKSAGQTVLATQSLAEDHKPESSVDYIFLDPPFGANLNYSELNLFWETWLGVRTDDKPEAIESKTQKKGPDEYRQLMLDCFSEAYRILKPGHWLTVEFSNTRASVWNGIQTAISEAGFIVASVSALDKKQGSFNAVNNTTSVKQDLVISAYKPHADLESKFLGVVDGQGSVWEFVREHLEFLPIVKQQGLVVQFVSERDPRILYDQVIAYYVRKGLTIPVSSQSFQMGLSQRFIERDGMYFLPSQIAEYDRKKLVSGELAQIAMFVSDEASAIQWLRQLIKEKPQKFSDINPHFMQQLGGWSKNEEQLDLRELLNQNFLCYVGDGPVPDQIHAYLSSNWKAFRNLTKDDHALIAKARDRWYVPDPNKAGDLEKLREKYLLKEFDEYKEAKKKLKVFRLEAVRAGFKKAWQDRDYALIVAVADKIPAKVLEEDPKLLMWYDQAMTRMGAE